MNFSLGLNSTFVCFFCHSAFPVDAECVLNPSEASESTFSGLGELVSKTQAFSYCEVRGKLERLPVD